MSNTEHLETTNPWVDDVLGREQLGEMLEKHIVSRASGTDINSLTIALDGRWGSGKTFFVHRWAEALKQKGHGVVMFDAWSHDYAADPTLAFMAELRKQLRLFLEGEGWSNSSPEALQQQLDSVISSFKKAIIPAASVVASGVVKKLTGVDLDKLSEAFSSDTEGLSTASADSAGSLQISNALDFYLDQLLQEHDQRKQSIYQFRSELFSLVESLIEAEAIRGPLFVIIDELDRCRPDFAIRLLEGIKHIFNVEKVVFVVATNAKQLSSSIQAVYGPNFDGRDYLGRFFDLEVQLPTPTPLEFSSFLASKNGAALPTTIFYGSLLPEVTGDPSPLSVVWSAMNSALNLTLRQEKQAHVTFLLACQSWHKQTAIPGLWLIFLSALHRSNPEIFLQLQDSREPPSEFSAFDAKLRSINWQDILFKDRGLHLQGAPNQPNSMPLSRILYYYYRASKLTERQAMREFATPTDRAAQDLTEFLNHGPQNQPTSLHYAFWLVSTAGTFTAA